ncbi:carotenoid ester lipase [Colletotrichum higginsianum]|uniref:Carboxylic ester hydrolase n=1 Tax=Colletotrichum higginsianum (strain IMI 349063) TaxID=759273 RepID=H1UXU8_COLHI|nr:carotenoid ester lipase [Colletotrichum higginsianum]
MTSSIWVGLTALLAASNSALAVAKPVTSRSWLKPKVEIDYANITGRVSGNIKEFLGIPFASAGRFEHPQLFTQQLGDFDGSSYGPICPQKTTASILTKNSSSSLVLGETGTAIGPVVGALADTVFNTLGQTRSEDCLLINVQTPVNASRGDKLPVVIWIHGGGFEVGSPFTDTSETDVIRGAALNYNVGGLVRTSVNLGQPIIGVSANYRLNAFGFSASREMEEAGLLNLGLEDQRVAMKWVQEHIADFGGDPDRVVIMGESAGSWSVVAHLLWDEGEGATDLFRGAMALSGGPVMVESAERAQPFFDNMVERAGCAEAMDKIACLKVADFDDIMASVNEEGMLLGPRSLASTWTIRPDGKHLKDSPHRLAAAGKMASVPLITGDMRDEGTLFSLLAQLETLSDEDFASYFQTTWWPKATDADMAALMELYPSDVRQGSPFDTGVLNAVTPNFKRLAAVVGDFSFQAQRRNLLAHYNTSEQAVWNYITDVSVPAAGLLPDLGVLTHLPVLGSFHAFDVWFYMFAGLPYGLSKNTQAYQATAISFIRTLDPNNHGLDLAKWPRYTEDGLETYNFKESGPKVVRDDWRVEAMQFFNDHPDSFLI